MTRALIPSRGWWYGAAAAFAAALLPPLLITAEPPPAPPPPRVETTPIEPISLPPLSDRARAALADGGLFGLRGAADGAARPAADDPAASDGPPAEGEDGALPLGWSLRGVVIRDGIPRAVFERTGGGAPSWVYLAAGEARDEVEVAAIAPDRVRLRLPASGRELTLRLFAFPAAR